MLLGAARGESVLERLFTPHAAGDSFHVQQGNG